MSQRVSPPRPGGWKPYVSVFAALGATARLRLVGKLSLGKPCSISALTAGSRLSRQAVTKHLRILERAGIVRGARRRRETLFDLDPRPVALAGNYLKTVSDQWERALERLRVFVERGPP
jgi:DNA-binding transcriptional ArsR family regulator